MRIFPFPLTPGYGKRPLPCDDAGYEVTVLCPRGKGYQQDTKFSKGPYLSASDAQGRKQLHSDICGNMVVHCSGSSFTPGGFFCARDFMSSRDAIRPTNFSRGAAVQALRREVHLRSSRCEPGAVSFEVRKQGFLYKVQVWLEKLTYRFSDVVMATNDSYKRSRN